MFRFLVLHLLLFPLSLANWASAQSSVQREVSSNTDAVDARTFALLFRRENAYLKQAKEAESQETPEAQLPFIMTLRLGLKEEQRSNFEQLTQAWEADVAPVRAEMNATISRFHATFPSGKLNADINATPPESIRELRREIDAITLQYRDRLRNAVIETDYQTLRDAALVSTGVRLTAVSPAANGGAQ